MPELLIKIRRVKGKDPATCITYTQGGGFAQWHPEPEKDEFDVPVIIAYFAIKEGFFEQHPKSKTKLKVVDGQVTSAVEPAKDEPPQSENSSNSGGA